MHDTLETLRNTLNILTPEDIQIIFDETRKLEKELMDEEYPQDWFNRHVLLHFKSKKYSQIPVKDLISQCLWVTKYDGAGVNRVQLSPNGRQDFVLTQLEGDDRVCNLSKFRVEGVTTILCAFCAVKAYLSKTKIVLFTPNAQIRTHVTELVLEFLQQLDAALELTDNGVFSVKSVTNGHIKIYDGSEIRIYSSYQVEPLRGQSNVDYVIFDESDYIKNINDLNAQAKMIISENGKILNTFTVGEPQLKAKSEGKKPNVCFF